jgi:ribosomal protein S18
MSKHTINHLIVLFIKETFLSSAFCVIPVFLAFGRLNHKACKMVKAMLGYRGKILPRQTTQSTKKII